MRSGALLLLIAVCAQGAAACDDTEVAGDGGTADAAIVSCGVMPGDGPSCANLTCPVACEQATSCGRFCGGGDCYTCSAGTWTRIVYDCIGQICPNDGGLPADATMTVDALIPGSG